MSDLCVLMLVGNDIRHDTRVLKSALAVADGGAKVTVVGYASSGFFEHRSFGGVEIYRLPIPWRAADRSKKRRANFVRNPVIKGINTTDRTMAMRRARIRGAEAAELGGRDREVRALASKVKAHLESKGGRVASGLSRVEMRGRRKALEVFDSRTEFVSWRRTLPAIDDYDIAYGDLIDRLEWDVIHAHDIHHMGTAARAVARRRARGEKAWWIYDAHEFVPGLSLYPPRTARVRAGYVDLEREFIQYADAVITVTEPLAHELQRRHELPELPGAVLNAPVLDGLLAHTGAGDVRAACGLGPGARLLVYAGGVTAARGVTTAVSALPDLPDEVHLAVICVPHTDTHPVRALRTLAADLGVADRVHFLPPVAPDDVSAFLSTADVGVIPLVHFGSHEFALANKLFEYLHGGLPLLVSDCKAQADFVRSHGVGEVHVAEDPHDFARAARVVLEREPELRRYIAQHPEMLAPYDWRRQSQNLRQVYRDLLGSDALTEPDAPTDLADVREEPLWRDDRPSVLAIGATNAAGQGWEWAKAAEKYIPGVDTYVVAAHRGGPLQFQTDETVDITDFTRNQQWAAALNTRAQNEWTHALIETGRPLFGYRYGKDFVKDVDALRAVGIRTGLIFHGSEIRDPALNAQRTPHSPYSDPTDPLTSRLQVQRDELMHKVKAFQNAQLGPVFVSTPDLLVDVPGAILLPVVVDVDTWMCESTAFDRDRPVVLHVPSRARIKGSEAADRVGILLEAEGLIEYRRMENVPPAEMRGHVQDCDILLDQFALGLYGVAALEGMAAGRIVLGHLTEVVREMVPDCPIVEANPDTLEQMLRDLLADREMGRQIARAGQVYARRVHDGRRSAEVLREHMHLHG